MEPLVLSTMIGLMGCALAAAALWVASKLER